MNTILYIHHSVTVGGSAISLLYTLQRLDPTKYHAVVAVIQPSPEIIQHYTAECFETIAWPGIHTFRHTALGWSAVNRPLTWPAAFQTATGWLESERRTLELVDLVTPDLVHLNSAVLVASAHALYRKKVPFVWHVREGAAYGHLGLRYAWMRRAMLRWPTELIFLSEAERLEWVGGARGRVITNFVDFSRFNRSLDVKQVRGELGIADDAKLVLYLGGASIVKGIFPLLEALALAKAKEPKLICMMPGSVYKPSGRWFSTMARAILPSLGSGTLAQSIDQTIERLGLEKTCIRTEFAAHVENLIAACDVVVFPATTNHFARPIVEASAMGKPVVASRFPIIEELVKHGETGLLVPPGDAGALAEAILGLLRDPEKRACFGERAHAIARVRFDATINAQAIMQVYNDILHRSDLPTERDTLKTTEATN